MIPKHCKRLAEVDFPIAEVSRHAVREKSIRIGHPSTLHLWWARRPLASSRAMLLALLLPDPADPACPTAFKQDARQALLALPSRPSSWDESTRDDAGLRRALLDFIADFANWSNSAKPAYLTASRALVRAAHPNETPLVVDPFAGGGSIPLEALRLGCDAFASDLNPVACLILKTMLEDIPRRGAELADELRKAGAQIKAQAERELEELYPKDPDGATPIAYLWARTIRCESPNCGAEIPLMRSMWLCNKTHRKRALRPIIARADGETPRVDFEIFEPQDAKEVSGGSVDRARATCPACRIAMPPPRVRAQLAEQRGGADAIFDDNGNRTGGARITAVVTLKRGEQGRRYRLPTPADYDAVRKAQARVAALIDDWEQGGEQGLCPVPNEPLNPIRPSPNARGLSAVTRYGMSNFGDLFTARQQIALTKFAELASGISDNAQRSLIALLLGKTADGNNSIARWESGSESMVNLFARQAIPIVWDFCESTPKSRTRGVFLSGIELACKVLETDSFPNIGLVQQANATDHPLLSGAANIWFTDPPYYDAIPYADLSDFFLVWLKRIMPDNALLQDPFNPDNPLSPKIQECVWNQSYEYDGRPKDAAFFETTITKAFGESRRILAQDGVGAVVFAHQSTEGWEAFLGGLVSSDWTITASWPIATEMPTRIRARDNASLATSVHLVCRPRPDDAPVGDWAEALRELPARVGAWIELLQSEGVRGADLVFACVGPALEIFSRYSRVETAAGDAVGLPEYLERVWETVGRVALEQVLGAAEARARNGSLGALEEDSRLTALFLWTLQSGDAADDNAAARYASGYRLPYDVVRRFTQPLGIHLDEWEGHVVDVKKGDVRLLPVKERARDLLGETGAGAYADTMRFRPAATSQLILFPDPTPEVRGSRLADAAFDLYKHMADTTLNRVHRAMLLHNAGHSATLRDLLQAEQERGPDFMRLANALSALYPRGSEEKRLLDAMLLAAPGKAMQER